MNLLFLLFALGACTHPPAPVPPTPAAETQLDPSAVDLEVVEGHVAALSAADCWIVALRAHDAVLALEATPTDANRSQRWRLHALAATLGECAGLARAPFYGKVGGQVVDLHDLRNAQLLREDPRLASDAFGPVADARREYAQHYLGMGSDPASAAPEEVLGLLRAPLAGTTGH